MEWPSELEVGGTSECSAPSSSRSFWLRESIFTLQYSGLRNSNILRNGFKFNGISFVDFVFGHVNFFQIFFRDIVSLNLKHFVIFFGRNFAK
jgi:hypothetical protein